MRQQSLVHILRPWRDQSPKACSATLKVYPDLLAHPTAELIGGRRRKVSAILESSLDNELTPQPATLLPLRRVPSAVPQAQRPQAERTGVNAATSATCLLNLAREVDMVMRDNQMK